MLRPARPSIARCQIHGAASTNSFRRIDRVRRAWQPLAQAPPARSRKRCAAQSRSRPAAGGDIHQCPPDAPTKPAPARAQAGSSLTASRKSAAVGPRGAGHGVAVAAHPFQRKWMSQRWRWGGRPGSVSSASRAGRWAWLNAAPAVQGPRPRGAARESASSANSGEPRRGERLAVRPRSGSCRAWCRWARRRHPLVYWKDSPGAAAGAVAPPRPGLDLLRSARASSMIQCREISWPGRRPCW